MSVDIDKPLRKLLELRNGNRCSADAAGAFAVGADAALYNQLIIRLNVVLTEPVLTAGSVENRRDKPLFGAPAHKLLADSAAEHRANRVNDDRLTRARLARQNVQTLSKADIRLFNNSYILNVKFVKHSALLLRNKRIK